MVGAHGGWLVLAAGEHEIRCEAYEDPAVLITATVKLVRFAPRSLTAAIACYMCMTPSLTLHSLCGGLCFVCRQVVQKAQPAILWPSRPAPLFTGPEMMLSAAQLSARLLLPDLDTTDADGDTSKSTGNDDAKNASTANGGDGGAVVYNGRTYRRPRGLRDDFITYTVEKAGFGDGTAPRLSPP